MTKQLILIVCYSLIFTSILTAEKHPITVEDLWAMGRIGDLVLSPDGEWIAYTVTQYCLESNKGNSDIWLISTSGGEARQMTNYEGYDGHPQWSPDSKEIAFISRRASSSQIFKISLLGGESQKVSDIPTEVESFVWSPNGKYFAFTTQVYADAENLEASAKRDKEKEESKVKAQIIDHLLYRIWNRWTEGKRSHVFIIPANGGEAWDVTPGDYDTPPLDLGGVQDWVFSPDSKELAFVRNTDPMVAISTNNDIFIVPVTGDKAICITDENDAVDNQPVYSPDGKYIAYRAMKRPKFEADEYELIIYDRATCEKRNLTEDFHPSVGQVIWSPDSKRLFFTAYDKGRNCIFSIDLKNKIDRLVQDHFNSILSISPDAETIYFKQQAVNRPYEIFKMSLKKKSMQQLTFTNQELLAQLEMNPIEDFWFDSFDGTRVHGLLVKPPFFDETKKYPLIYLIHGGPQGMWSDNFHYRWNASMFAAPGYVVAMVNFRGSKGYGQDFCDAVTKDWGGGPYKDLMKGLDYIIENYDYIDANRLAAAGASYGGYMVNWIAGHPSKYKVFVSHAGVFDLLSKYGGTEELWFPEWEFGGNPYENPELYQKWSPSYFAKNYKIPTLVIHGQHDYRVPVTQGMQMFTALQRMGVPSRLLYFPDEHHFITKPQNAKLWWDTVHGWIDKWLSE